MDAWLAQDKLFPLLPGNTQEQITGLGALVGSMLLSTVGSGVFGSI